MKAGRVYLWRIERARFLATARTGEGARLAGGRWNSAGRPAIYCGTTLELCILEILVHACTAEERADRRLCFRISAAATEVQTVAVGRLPVGWNDPRRLHPETIAIGDRWLARGRKPALRVPSAVVAGAWNVILNPLHPRFRRIRWSRPSGLPIDPRLFPVAP